MKQSYFKTKNKLNMLRWNHNRVIGNIIKFTNGYSRGELKNSNRNGIL